MNSRKIMHSLALFSLLLGGVSPVVQATETSSSSSVEASSSQEISSSSSTTSSVEISSEPSTSTSLEESVEESSSSSTKESQVSLSEVTTTTGTIVPEMVEGQANPEAIVGTDDQRRVTNTTLFPYRTVVYLEMLYGNDVYSGTGVLIAPNLVLTVAHNVYNRQTKQWADTVKLAPGKNGSSNPFGVYSASNYYVLRNFKSAGQRDYMYHDIAVIRLNSSVPATVGYLPVSTSQTIGDHVQLPGYPSYTESKVYNMYTSVGEIDDMSGSLLGYTIDAEPGNSGSPILNSNNQVVGVHSSGIHETDDILYGVYNVGRRVDQSVLDMIDIAKNDKAVTVGVSHNRETKTGVVYRLYNPKTQHYFYTKSLDEAAILKGRGWNFEGRGFTTADSGQPVYRLYNAERKAYLFTTNEAEKNSIVNKGWKYEGVAWYSGGGQPVFRLFNPVAKVHMYTTSTREVRLLRSRGWKYEGVTFYTVSNLT